MWHNNLDGSADQLKEFRTIFPGQRINFYKDHKYLSD